MVLETKDNKKENNLPWIVAAVISAVTLLVSFLQGKRQDKLGEKQLAAALSTAESQIRSNTEIAKEQIQSENANAIKNIKVAVLSSNRQAWINELRELSACRRRNTSTSAVLRDVIGNRLAEYEEVKCHRQKYQMEGL